MTLKPEKLRGKLKWWVDGSELVLLRGGIVVGTWSPFQYPAHGVVSIYGEPRGKSLFYKTWRGWKNAVRKYYQMRPPRDYAVRWNYV